MADPTNSQIAEALDELGDLNELDGAIIHRVVAYRNAAKAVREAPTSVAALARLGRATAIPGIGATIQEKVVALAQTGSIPAAVKLRAKYPPGLVELTHLPGLGPKRARRLYDELAIDSPAALRQAIGAGRVRTLKGFGVKAEASLLSALDSFEAEGRRRRVVLDRALAVGEQLVAALREQPAARRVELAGSARRMAESVKDLDIIATVDGSAPADAAALARAAASLALVESAGTPGDSGVRLHTHTALPVDVRIVADDQFGNLLQHLTGSKQHNTALREFAVRRGLHVSEYGVLDDATGITHRCATEAEVYALLGMAYIEPELRENRGELEAALLDGGSGLPELVKAGDLRGDLHCHTTASDGTASIEEMALAAREAGYQYLAITDHSASMGFGAEVSPAQLLEQVERIRSLSIPGIQLLAGSEVNILPDGSLDYDDEHLAALDWVIASVHTSFRMPSAAMTDPHRSRDRAPARRRDRPPLGAQDRAARALRVRLRGCAARRRAHGDDARDQRQPRPPGPERGACSGGSRCRRPDCHQLRRPPPFRLRGGAATAIATARRAWLTASQVANCLPWPELAPLRSRAPRWILMNQIRPPSVPIIATQKLSRSPRMCTE